MKILITGLLCFGIWATGTTYWYLCHIENLCPSEQSNKNLALNIPAKIEVEKSTIDKKVDENPKKDNPKLSTAVENDAAKIESSGTKKTFTYNKSLIYYFDFNADDLSQSLIANNEFTALIQHLKENREAKIIITGHTDNIGSNENNYNLGMHRAQNIADILKKANIVSNRIEINSKGESSPLSVNDSEIGRAKNRRIEIVLIK
jgi:outer membrane protein OmpA-like peptidoglycan-associated protein